jgi:antirestriction protein ArdC
MMRYYNVFEINTQCEGLKTRRKEIIVNNDPISEAEKIIAEYPTAPPVKFAPGRAYYMPSQDYISVPSLNDYLKPAEYYSTLFHEMTHSTGHKSRLNRAGIEAKAAFGSETYSREELIAEIGAAFLCSYAGIVQETLDNSAAYIASWKKFLKNDSKAIVTAASQAQKAANYILGIKEAASCS